MLLCFPAGFLWGAATSGHQVEGDRRVVAEACREGLQ